MKTLDFPSVRQNSVDTCSCASALACLCYYGFNPRELQIRRLMNVGRNPQEVHPRKIIKAIRHFKLKAQYKKLTIDNLIRYIDKRIPVIINLQGWSGAKNPDYTEKDDNGHYAVAMGYCDKKKRIFFSDPSSFLKVYLSYDELELRWHDGDKEDWDYDHMGIVVLGKKPVYKSDRIIKMK